MTHSTHDPAIFKQRFFICLVAHSVFFQPDPKLVKLSSNYLSRSELLATVIVAINSMMLLRRTRLA
jgi:hypothetical protein